MSSFLASRRALLATPLTTFDETLLESVRVVCAPEEIRDRVRRRDIATRREDLVAIAVRVGDVHQAVRESAANVGGDDRTPQVRAVCGGIRLAAHVLPVDRPVAAVELREAGLFVGDLARDRARVVSRRIAIMQSERLATLDRGLFRHDALSEVARGLQPLHEVLWDRRARFDVLRETTQHLELQD